MGFVLVETALRWLVIVAFGGAVVVAATHWAVRARRVQPFGILPRTVRRASDPVVRPLERRILRFGGNPQDAPWWLLGLVVALGLVLLSLVRWVAGWWYRARVLAGSGPGTILYTLLGFAFGLLQIALLVRVVGSWFGAGRYNRWVRWSYLLTDWIVEPLRRVLPAMGPFDLSPMAAYFLLWILEALVMRALRPMVG